MQGISGEAVAVYRDPLITQQMGEPDRPEGRKFFLNNSYVSKQSVFGKIAGHNHKTSF